MCVLYNCLNVFLLLFVSVCFVLNTLNCHNIDISELYKPMYYYYIAHTIVFLFGLILFEFEQL